MTRTPAPASVFRNPIHFLAFGLGSGAVPYAPGTFGTVAAVPFYLLFAHLSLGWYLLLWLFLFGIGIYLCDRTARDIGIHDHGGIVWDEFVGYWLTMVAAPPGWGWIIAGFVLFRFFDVIKPFPISWLDKHIHGGFGIMLDDTIAAIFAWVCMQLLVFAISAL